MHAVLQTRRYCSLCAALLAVSSCRWHAVHAKTRLTQVGCTHLTQDFARNKQSLPLSQRLSHSKLLLASQSTMHTSRHSEAQDCSTFAAGHAEHAMLSDFKLSSHCGSNHLPASHPTLQLLQRILCWIAAAVRQAHPHCFNGTSHCVGSVHATTSTSSGTCISVDVKPLCLINQVGCKCTCSRTAAVGSL